MNTCMRYMEKLLEGVEVEWKTLGEVGELVRGNGLQKKDFTETGVPAIHYGQIFTRYGLFASKTFSFTSERVSQKLKKANKNDLLIATTSENDEDVLKPLAWLGGEAVISGDMMILRHQQNVKYLAYYFQTDFFRKVKMKYVTGTKVRRVSKDNILSFQIPIPPLHIQDKIVQILDTFTALTAELTAELTARKKQYNYYREKLLQFGPDVEWKTLGEVGELVRGNGLQKKDFTESGVPAIHYGQIFTRYGLFASKTVSYTSELVSQKLKKANKNDLLIATTSENDEDVLKPLAWLGDEAAISGDMMILRHQQNVKYLAYYFQTDFFRKAKMKYVTGTKVRRVSKDNILSFQIPIPPLSEQERIVSILDKFDALTHSISEGLPREIELRQKQYEYYRDMLLNFPKPPKA